MLPDEFRPLSSMTVPAISQPPRSEWTRPLALGEERQVVDVVGADHLTPVERARTLVILQVERVADRGQVIRGEIDLVRVRVIEFAAEAPLVLQTQTGLEAVVVAVGGVFFLGDAVVALVRCGTGSSHPDRMATELSPRRTGQTPSRQYLSLPSPESQRDRNDLSVLSGKLLMLRSMF